MRQNRFSFKIVPARAAPLLASLCVHVSVFASVTGGHGAATATLRVPTADTIELIELTDLRREDEPVLPPISPKEPNLPVPTHEHPYPVPPSHNTLPHDSSLVHVPVAASATPKAEAQAVIQSAQATPTTPQFTVALGNSMQTSRTIANGAQHAGTSVGTDAVPESGVSIRARILSVAPVVYPPGARANEVEADVPVEIVVGTDGQVTEARLLHRAGYGFDDAALEAVRRYRFTPSQKAGQIVPVRMQWVVQFRLN